MTEFNKIKEEIGWKNRTLCLFMGIKSDSLKGYSCGRLPIPAHRMDRLRLILAEMKEILKKVNKSA